MGKFDEWKASRLWERANTFSIHEDYDAAIRISTKAISQYPDCVEAYRVRGMAYCWKKDYERAIADLNQALEFEPNNGYRYFLRGRVYFEKGDYDKAIFDFTQSLKFESIGYTHELAQEYLDKVQAKLREI